MSSSTNKLRRIQTYYQEIDFQEPQKLSDSDVKVKNNLRRSAIKLSTGAFNTINIIHQQIESQRLKSSGRLFDQKKRKQTLGAQDLQSIFNLENVIVDESQSLDCSINLQKEESNKNKKRVTIVDTRQQTQATLNASPLKKEPSLIRKSSVQYEKSKVVNLKKLDKNLEKRRKSYENYMDTLDKKDNPEFFNLQMSQQTNRTTVQIQKQLKERNPDDKLFQHLEKRKKFIYDNLNLPSSQYSELEPLYKDYLVRLVAINEDEETKKRKQAESARNSFELKQKTKGKLNKMDAAQNIINNMDEIKENEFAHLFNINDFEKLYQCIHWDKKYEELFQKELKRINGRVSYLKSSQEKAQAVFNALLYQNEDFHRIFKEIQLEKMKETAPFYNLYANKHNIRELNKDFNKINKEQKKTEAEEEVAKNTILKYKKAQSSFKKSRDIYFQEKLKAKQISFVEKNQKKQKQLNLKTQQKNQKICKDQVKCLLGIQDKKVSVFQNPNLVTNLKQILEDNRTMREKIEQRITRRNHSTDFILKQDMKVIQLSRNQSSHSCKKVNFRRKSLHFYSGGPLSQSRNTSQNIAATKIQAQAKCYMALKQKLHDLKQL